MKRYVVYVPEWVALEIQGQVLHIALDSVDRALAWESRLVSAINGIGEHPGYAEDEKMSRHFGRTVRRMVFESRYLVFFSVKESAGVIEVLHFRHGARQSLGESGEA